jgi:hypothetical protein
MAKSQVWKATANELSQLGLSNAYQDAIDYGAAAEAEERADSTQRERMRADSVALQEDIRVGKERARMAGGNLPAGFEPVKNQKNLMKQGKWPALSDGFPGCIFPLHTLAKMGRSGGSDAKSWTEVWKRALYGDTAALREMGEITEKGTYGADVDSERAFFWYYRAGLNGDKVARQRAMDLKRSTTNISPATMEEPQLIYPGSWLIKMDKFGQAETTNTVDLISDGSLSGSVEGFGGNAWNMMQGYMALEPGLSDFVGSMMQSMVVEGRWAFDNKLNVMSLNMLYSVPGMPGGETLAEQVQLLGRNENGVLFGRDKKFASYLFTQILTPAGES